MIPNALDADCPEKRLVACCARTRMPPRIVEKIRALAARPLDWEFVLAAAAQNSITPLVALQLSAVAADVTPPEILSRLKNAARGNAMRCLQLTAELKKIFDLFTSAGIHAIPYKGPVIAALAYHDVALREYEDLDIVLPQGEIAKANDVLKTLGYSAKVPWLVAAGLSSSFVPGEYNYRDESRGLLVELHTEITLRHFPVRPNLEELCARLVRVSVGGQQMSTFAPEDGLLFLCVHGAKDYWERISWVADVAEFVQAQALDWDTVFQRAESLRLRRILHLGLALAAGLLDAPLAYEAEGRVRRDLVAKSLADAIQRRLLAREPAPFSAVQACRFRRQMMEGSLAGWRYFLRLASMPAEEDYQSARLPGFLAPLQMVMRPLRLLRKYGLRRARAPQIPR